MQPEVYGVQGRQCRLTAAAGLDGARKAHRTVMIIPRTEDANILLHVPRFRSESVRLKVKRWLYSRRSWMNSTVDPYSPSELVLAALRPFRHHPSSPESTSSTGATARAPLLIAEVPKRSGVALINGGGAA